MFCTANADEDSTWRGWQLGAASYVTKPFDNDELISELVRVTRPASDSGASEIEDGGQPDYPAFSDELDVWQQMVDSLPQIVWVTRPDGWHVYYNRQWYEYTGLSVERRAWLEPALPSRRPPAGTVAVGAGHQQRRALRDRVPAASPRRDLPVDARPGAPAARADR